MVADSNTFKSMLWPRPMPIFKMPRSDCSLTPTRLISGVMMLSVNLVTSAVNAVPMTTATARSTILPRERNSLNPLSIGMSLQEWTETGPRLLSITCPTAASCSVQGQGESLPKRRARHHVRQASRQRNQHYAVSVRL